MQIILLCIFHSKVILHYVDVSPFYERKTQIPSYVFNLQVNFEHPIPFIQLPSVCASVLFNSLSYLLTFYWKVLPLDKRYIFLKNKLKTYVFNTGFFYMLLRGIFPILRNYLWTHFSTPIRINKIWIVISHYTLNYFKKILFYSRSRSLQYLNSLYPLFNFQSWSLLNLNYQPTFQLPIAFAVKVKPKLLLYPLFESRSRSIWNLNYL
jgi:hypothetical protein